MVLLPYLEYYFGLGPSTKSRAPNCEKESAKITLLPSFSQKNKLLSVKVLGTLLWLGNGIP